MFRNHSGGLIVDVGGGNYFVAAADGRRVTDGPIRDADKAKSFAKATGFGTEMISREEYIRRFGREP